MTTYTLYLFDTLQRKELPILPSDGKTIKMYTCGPTVYDVAHIGNFRTFLFEDLLRRTLKLFGSQVVQVMNITDVDDKTIRNATAQKVSLDEYTAPFKEAFFTDIKTLRIQKAEYYPEATAYIDEMIEMIATLEKKGFAYIHTDSSLYFKIENVPGYGKLSHLKMTELKNDLSKRTAMDEYCHTGINDFALWKAYDQERDGNVSWESPWGKGRPGWHLECSVMAKEILGETIDLHAGGVDLIFPHHENEIAQSESTTGKPFALHWAHAEHLLVDHKKMSKKLGNFYTLRHLLDKGYSPSAIRFFLISNHYRTQLNFTLEGLDAALTSIKRIRDFVDRLQNPSTTQQSTLDFQETIQTYHDHFFKALSQDLNISEALSSLFDCIRHTNHLLDTHGLTNTEIKTTQTFMLEVDKILDILTPDDETLPKKIENLLEKRKVARTHKDWKTSDTIRTELSTLGYQLEDLPTGQRISKRSPIPD